LRHILVTHHHADHIGGVAALKQHYGARVWAPDDARIAAADHTCRDGDHIELDGLGLRFNVIEVPGHTRSHIAYHGHGALFCGDTVFSVGCGRLFEGTPEQMQVSLDRIAALPGPTQIYCAHEYTQSNCHFALAVEPHNEALRERAQQVADLRHSGKMTVPSTLEQELQVNPFMRTREPGVVEAARQRKPDASPGAGVLGVIRAWKDSF
jgi:hydroxyacylglutathione hydrolase